MSVSNPAYRKHIVEQKRRQAITRSTAGKPAIKALRNATAVIEPKLNERNSAHRRSITVRVPQGLGDIFWVYQKLSPYFDEINFEIMVANADEVSRRSESWLNLLPKTGRVGFHVFQGGEYEDVIAKKYYVRDVLKKWDNGERNIAYACNLFLEEGTRLDEIDEHAIETNVAVKSEPFNMPFSQYTTLYISGSTKPLSESSLVVWSIEDWVELIRRTYATHSFSIPVAVIGANFDRDVMYETVATLLKYRIDAIPFVQETPSRVCHILKNTRLFFGYQSGLNIIADNLDTPQVMLYFEHLSKMQYTWCKRENIRTKFHAGLFTQSPKEIATQLEKVEL